MNRERESKICLERLGYFTDEISRWNRAFLKVQNGMPFKDALGNEVFIEDRLVRNHVFHALAIMIEHILLLKMKYYADDRLHGNWSNVIKESQSEAAGVMEWNKKERDIVLLQCLSGELQAVYEAGVKRYRKTGGHYADRADRPQFVPEYCPWSLEELVNGTVGELLEKLPD